MDERIKTMLKGMLMTLNESEFQEVFQLVHNERVRRDNLLLPTLPELNDEEKELVAAKQPIEAIRRYRDRTGHNLILAKLKVDHYRWNK